MNIFPWKENIEINMFETTTELQNDFGFKRRDTLSAINYFELNE